MKETPEMKSGSKKEWRDKRGKVSFGHFFDRVAKISQTCTKLDKEVILFEAKVDFTQHCEIFAKMCETFTNPCRISQCRVKI